MIGHYINDVVVKELINNELDKVYTWLCVNRLSLNIEKTKFIIFHNKGKITYSK